MEVITEADSFGVQGNKTQLTLKSQVFNMLTLKDSKPPIHKNKDKVKAICIVYHIIYYNTVDNLMCDQTPLKRVCVIILSLRV